MLSVRIPGFLRKELRRAAAHAHGHVTPPITLSRALLVGANIQKIPGPSVVPTFDAGNRVPFLAHRDAEFLADTAPALPAHGFVLSPEIDVRVANLNIDPSHDFLTANYKADFVMFCHLYHNNLDAVQEARENDPDQKIVTQYTREGMNPARTQSIHADKDWLWQCQLDDSGAQVAVNVNMVVYGYVASLDFPSSTIARKPFRHAAQTENISTRMHCDIFVREPATAASQRALVPA